MPKNLTGQDCMAEPPVPRALWSQRQRGDPAPWGRPGDRGTWAGILPESIGGAGNSLVYPGHATSGMAQPPGEKTALTSTTTGAAEATTPTVPAAQHRGAAAGTPRRGGGTGTRSISYMRPTTNLVPPTKLLQAAATL
ncbi:unnamed protein product [Anisakis simplex]|uniref:RBPJ-interacting and tubulin-associated protein 1 n=1 Tax=Anisakis simplex TaxID=6269 RepID=A0A0M3KCZ1_ANISI|nr:unnamed protein product [Anisakis simplex]